MKSIRILAVCTLFGLALIWSSERDALGQADRNNFYQKWLDTDVLYIITPEEREVFLKLQTDGERERFIEQFWRRRDPDPRTARNEFIEEHYRRIAYANEHFASGIPGWKTDRGMIYIKFGTPTSIESRPSGGHYQRPSYEGGGSTSTYPFEKWEYNYIPGVGQDVELEFVDDTLTGEYRLTMNPDDKDAFLHVPNIGLTDAEDLGLVEQKRDRIVRKSSPMPRNDPILAGGRSKDQPFEKLDLLFRLSKAPTIDFSDFRSKVEATVHFDQIPFQVRSDSFKFSDTKGRVVLTLFVDRRNLAFQKAGEVYTAEITLYGTVKNLSGRTLAELEESLTNRVPAEWFDSQAPETLVFDKELNLPPGRFKLALYLKDMQADRIAAQQNLLIVDDFSGDNLMISSVQLARQISSLPSPGGNSKTQQLKVFPVAGNTIPFERKKLGIYFEVYNFTLDQAGREPQLDVGYEILNPDGSEAPAGNASHTSNFAPGKVSILSVLAIPDLERGTYTLRIKIKDLVSGEELTQKVPFHLQ